MKRIGTFTSALFILTMLAGLAINQPTYAGDPPKVAASGTKMSWKNLQTGEIENGVIGSSSGDKVNWRWEGKIRSGVLLCFYCGGENIEYDEEAQSALWPLAVGKKVSFERNRERRRYWRNDTEVVAREVLKLEFGDVDTFKVEMKSNSTSGSWTGKQTAWYAPKIGWTVKFISTDNEGANHRWEAVSFE